MDINQYISATRNIIGPCSPILEKDYKHILELCKIHSPVNIQDINLHTTYSSNKTAEVINTGNKKYLIYDQYLGQCFNMLNRIYFNSNNPITARNYSYKLLAEEFQLQGQLKLSLVCAGAYRTEIDKNTSYKIDKNLSDRLSHTSIQEAFVIFHEVAHYICSIKKLYPEQLPTKETTIDLLESKFLKRKDPKGADAYLKDRHALLYKGGSYKNHLTKKQVRQFKQDHKEGYKNYILKLISIVETNNNILEEMFCDDFATELCLKVFQHHFNKPFDKIINAVYTGMMNLRTLGTINNQSIDFLKSSNSTNDFINQSNIRLMRQRDKASFYYGKYLGNMQEAYKIQNLLTETNIRYTKIIYDPILFLTPDSLSRIKDMDLTTTHLEPTQFIEANESIKSVLYPKINFN